MSLQCPECNREFTIKSNLTRHLRMVHGMEVERIDILPGDFDTFHYKCLEGCNISFKYNRDLRKHLRFKHEINLAELNLDFPNSEEFHKWLHNEEANNYVQYVHLTATKRKTTGTETYYYECNRTGKRSCVDDTVRKRRARKLVTKLNRGCTSQIIVHKLYDGTFSVAYYKSHYGHEIGPEHVKLSKHDRGAIASKLLLGLPISSVLNSAKNTDGNLKRINLLARKDIVNIRRSFNIDLKDGKLANVDAINVNLFLAECNSHEYNPILYCSLQEFPKSEEIYLIIMSKYQADILSDVGNNIVVVNSTSLNNCDFELICLFVISKTWESFPTACMFTNKNDFDSYQLFFSKIKDRIGVITPTILLTNCDCMYYEAWKSVMGESVHNLYNPVQVELDWKLNLNRIVCDENEVTRIKRKWVFDSLKSLQQNKDDNDFAESLEDTLRILGSDEDFSDFVQYFVKNYEHAKKWADCYKVDLDLPTKQLQMISDVLKQYLNEDTEVRFDKIFHSLIRFVRDETVNSMLKTNSRSFFVNQNDTRHRLLLERNLSGTHLGENLWNVVEQEEFKIIYVVERYLERKCCNLICTTCNICLHCFSCSCVDFFIGNVICVHIHYIWFTYFQSIQDDDCENDLRQACDEEIIIEVDENQVPEENYDDVEVLKKAVTDKATLLCSNLSSVHSKNTLEVILETMNQLCDLSSLNEEIVGEEQDSKILDDHAYL